MTLSKTMIAERLSAEIAVSDIVQQALEAIRKHLGMEAAYLSEFVDGKIVFRCVDAPGMTHVIDVGDTHAMEETYCRHILEGQLPDLIADTSKNPIARSLAITETLQIGSHIAIPIKRRNGEPYGMICCLSRSPHDSLNPRDLETMRMFAELVSRQVNREIEERSELELKANSIRSVLKGSEFSIAYQPIVDLNSMKTAGFEALCRFEPPPYRPPDAWFRDAVAVGLGGDLELAVLDKALAFIDKAPADLFLALNVSPETVSSGRLADLLARAPLERLVLELTEHAPVDDYGALRATLAPLIAGGVRIAVDDAGSGYSSFRHILQLRPEIIKLDINLTRHVDSDPGRRALTTGIMSYAHETGAMVIAEGIETVREKRTLKSLGVEMGQGYLLGYPGELPDAENMAA